MKEKEKQQAMCSDGTDNTGNNNESVIKLPVEVGGAPSSLFVCLPVQLDANSLLRGIITYHVVPLRYSFTLFVQYVLRCRFENKRANKKMRSPAFDARLREDATRRQAALESRSAMLNQDWTFQPTLSAASERVVGDSAWAGTRHHRTDKILYSAHNTIKQSHTR